MKKLLTTALLTSLFFGSLFAAPKKPLNLEPIQIDPIVQKNDYIEVISDPRLEVIGIICRLAGYEGFTNSYNGEATYTTQIDSYFSKYKDEKVVLTAKAFKDRGIDAASMISLAYHINPDFSGTVIDFDPYPDTLLENWKKIKTNEIYKFITNIHDFVIKSNYSRLLILNRGDLLASVGYFYKDYEDYAMQNWVDDFFGKKTFDKQVISVNRICPLYMAFDIVKDREGKLTSYTTVYPGCGLLPMLLTYLSNFIQGYADANWDKVKDNFTALILDMGKRMYPDDYKKYEKELRKSVNKDLFVSVMSNFVAMEYLRSPIFIEAAEKKEITNAYEAAFSEGEKTFSAEWYYQLVDLTHEYVNNRDKYPTFEEFFPQIVDLINSISFE